MEYIVCSDELISKGDYFSDFFVYVLVTLTVLNL